MVEASQDKRGGDTLAQLAGVYNPRLTTTQHNTISTPWPLSHRNSLNMKLTSIMPLLASLTTAIPTLKDGELLLRYEAFSKMHDSVIYDDILYLLRRL